MVPLKAPKKEDSAQLKATIIIPLEKCLHRTSELMSTKYDSACIVHNWIFSVDLT